MRNVSQILKENWKGGKSLTTSKFKSMVPSSEGPLPGGPTGISGSGGFCGWHTLPEGGEGGRPGGRQFEKGHTPRYSQKCMILCYSFCRYEIREETMLVYIHRSIYTCD